MPSRSLKTWQTSSAAALDEIEAAHLAVGGSGRGRRYATQQINQAYAVLLSSQFQRFCRGLYAEAVDHVRASVANPTVRGILRDALTDRLRLSVGNPNPGNIGVDFARLGMDFWTEVNALDRRNHGRRVRLEQLNRWRNAIAHQDFDRARLGGRTELRLADVRRWRRSCNALAESFDFTVGSRLAMILGEAPW